MISDITEEERRMLYEAAERGFRGEIDIDRLTNRVAFLEEEVKSFNKIIGVLLVFVWSVLAVVMLILIFGG